MKPSMLQKNMGPNQTEQVHSNPGAAVYSATAGANVASEEDEGTASEYTDADESISAPTEILAEFLSAIMGKDYPNAFKYCKLILQYEPNNTSAKEFYPLIIEKLIQMSVCEDGDSDTSSSAGDSRSGSSEEDLSDEEDEKDDNDNSSVDFEDTDGTTASYSSLEDEEAEAPSLMTPHNDNEDAGNGNFRTVMTESERKHASGLGSPQRSPATLFEALVSQTPVFSSDSESPTEPISQQLGNNISAIISSGK